MLEIDELIIKHARAVRRALRELGVCEADIDDAAQRVFLTLARKRESIRPGSERAYVRAITLREASHCRRGYQRRRDVPQDEFDDAVPQSVLPEDLAIRKQRTAAFSRLMRSMKSDLRRILVLIELEGLSANEASDRLGIPVGTCKSRLRRARADLTNRVEALPESIRTLVSPN